MKILIVSFDKALVKKLKNLLPTHEIIEVKNGEEAVKTVRTDVDFVIYDAISGALSEEDINNMYKQRFGDAKFIILVDELFPVDMGNILTPNKVRLSREDEVEKVKDIIEGGMPVERVEETPPPVKEQVEEMPEPQEFVIEHTSMEEPVGSFEVPQQEEPKPVVEETPVNQAAEGGSKVLVVSFDNLLIDNIRSVLGEEYQVEVAKNTKDALEKKSDAPVVIYDAISGVIAEKGLIELSQDPDYSKKAYIILIDELFPINVDNVPLDNKEVLSREAEVHLIKGKVEEAVSKVGTASEPVPEPVISDTSEDKAVEDIQPAESVTVPEMENINIEEITKEVVQVQEETKKEEIPVEEPPSPPSVEKVEGVNTEEIVEKVIKSIDFEGIVERAVKSSINESMISELIRREIETAFANIDIQGIIKEVVAGIVRDRVEELLS